MAGSESQGQKRVIVYTPLARSDIQAIDLSTTMIWGEAQSERYLKFIFGEIEELATDPSIGYPTERFPGVYVYLAKTNRKRLSHGHRIIYRITDSDLEIIRVLHTAMDWESRME